MKESAKAGIARAAMVYDELPIGEESCHDVLQALRKLKLKPLPNGGAEVFGEKLEAPLLRALFRWEAELLRNDADAMGPDGRMTRRDAERRHDAFEALLEEVLDARRCIETVRELKDRRSPDGPSPLPDDQAC